jgi:hypothetical protein
MHKQTNTPSPSPKGFQSPKFSDSDFREVRGLGLGRPKSSVIYHWQRVFSLNWRAISKQSLLIWDKRKHCVFKYYWQIDVLFIYSGRHLAFSVSSWARHFKTEPTEIVALCFGYPKTPCLRAEGKLSSSVDKQMCCSSTQKDSLSLACLHGLARHFITEPTEIVALCFGYPKTPCLWAEGKLSSSVDELHKGIIW